MVNVTWIIFFLTWSPSKVPHNVIRPRSHNSLGYVRALQFCGWHRNNLSLFDARANEVAIVECNRIRVPSHGILQHAPFEILITKYLYVLNVRFWNHQNPWLCITSWLMVIPLDFKTWDCLPVTLCLRAIAYCFAPAIIKVIINAPARIKPETNSSMMWSESSRLQSPKCGPTLIGCTSLGWAKITESYNSKLIIKFFYYNSYALWWS